MFAAGKSRTVFTLFLGHSLWVNSLCLNFTPSASQHITRKTDQRDQTDERDNLDASLPLWVVVPDLYSTGRTQETRAT